MVRPGFRPTKRMRREGARVSVRLLGGERGVEEGGRLFRFLGVGVEGDLRLEGEEVWEGGFWGGK